MSRFSKARTITGSIVALLCVAPCAFAESPWNFSAGPQVMFSWGKQRGLSWGWEGGAGYGPNRLNLGQAYGLGMLSYVVAEPYSPLYIGGTLGVGYGASDGVMGVYGLWSGVPVIYPDDCQPERRDDFGFLLTLALGYRHFGGHQLYITTKAGASRSVTACSTTAGASALHRL